MHKNPPAPVPEPGTIESEYGVPIPGVILPKEQWAKTALKELPKTGHLNWETVFGRVAPLVMELGCGNARYTLMSAIARPGHNHFACDIFPAVIRYGTRRASQRGLHNTRFAVRDSQSMLRELTPPGSADEIHIYHPQPYHNPAFMRRRLITPFFLRDVHAALKPGGLFVIQTDSPDYWRYMLEVIPAFFEFTERREPWEDAKEGRSRREILARSQGLPIYRGFGIRNDNLTEAALTKMAKTLHLPKFRTAPLQARMEERLDSFENPGVTKPEPRENSRGNQRGNPRGNPRDNTRPNPRARSQNGDASDDQTVVRRWQR